MKIRIKDKKAAAIRDIKLSTKLYNLTSLVVIFTLLLIIVNAITPLFHYIPVYSIVALLSIVSILVVINFYLSKKGAASAIHNMEDYEKKANSLLSAMEKEMESQKLSQEELDAISLKDELTGLHNRHGFMPLAEQYLKTLSRGTSIVYMFYANIDNMKQINDAYGYLEGDSVIKTVADILHDVYSGSDLVARIGKDEFVVLPAGSTESGVELSNNQLRKRFDEINETAGKTYTISISYGVAEYNPLAPSSIEDLLARAEAVMYEQKQKKQDT